MYIKILCRVALTHAQDNPVGNPAVVRLDAAGVARLYDITNEAIEKIKTEMKAQRIADTHGGKILIMMIIMMICLSPTAIGWKTVKEYEMPELAENEDDAKAIRAAVARAKRTKDAWGFGKKRGNGGFGRRRGGGYGAGGYGGYGGAVYAQPPPPGVFPVAPPPAQYMPAPPAARGRGGGMAPRGPPRACYRCGHLGHLQDFCPNGPPRI